jgi:hypothetical protein
MKRYLIIAAVAVAAFLLLAFAPRAFANHAPEREARLGADWVRLSEHPCENQQVIEIARNMGADPAGMNAGTSNIGGTNFALCWVPLEGHYGVVFEDGDIGRIPMVLFEQVGN